MHTRVCLTTILTTVLVIRRTLVVATAGASIPLRGQLGALAASRRYLSLLHVGFLQQAGEGIGHGSFAHFCIYVVQQPLSGIGLVVLAATAGRTLGQPI